MRDLQDRHALVTGASSGIGAATARALHGAGARLTLVARRVERLEALAQSLPGSRSLPLDVTQRDAVAQLLGAEAFDIVINNAGLARGVDPLQSGSPAEWDEVVDTNVKGVLYVARATLPAMIARGHGDMLFLGSAAGRQVYPGGTVYCASKHAVRAIYEGLRLDACGSGIRFSTVDPGLVHTDFGLTRFRGDEKKALAAYQGITPLTADDIADIILYVLTRPPHVNIGELVLWPTDQASTTRVHRRTSA